MLPRLPSGEFYFSGTGNASAKDYLRNTKSQGAAIVHLILDLACDWGESRQSVVSRTSRLTAHMGESRSSVMSRTGRLTAYKKPRGETYNLCSVQPDLLS